MVSHTSIGERGAAVSPSWLDKNGFGEGIRGEFGEFAVFRHGGTAFAPLGIPAKAGMGRLKEGVGLRLNSRPQSRASARLTLTLALSLYGLIGVG